ncbi:MAG: tRNA uridine-5-carboxymethylaminomethyl(34) synthesis enzyme MnmG [Clostridia bacterium]|nr:tRNA uridine-5-carboxymethylaminomethyl(34) synthesis enzyme MnmG [Clostridia bacterium]
MCKNNCDYNYDAIIVGAGHAGIEAGLALARKGHKTLMLSISLDNIGYLACNPSIGGTAKGHLVCEIDALGGEMGKAADKTTLQLRMLNMSKGPAVQSLRAQVDKFRYHNYMKNVLENTPNMYLRQAEAKSILVEDNKVIGIQTTQQTFFASIVILCSGVYLKSEIIIGTQKEQKGPSSFMRSQYLSDSLTELGFELRRFKTGTPARIKRDSVDLSKLEVQNGDEDIYSFCALSDKIENRTICYLGYTNSTTHDIIRENLDKTARVLGLVKGAGARYCPSIEDKIVRFSDKERHQFFLEPEGEDTQEMYVQGISTSLPASVQLDVYRSISGFENVHIMRDAYAIEYDCIDPTELYPTLMSKRIDGLYFAGQINGTSGYEEAAAQGIVAGINAALKLEGKEQIIFGRENSYIGVLIDDLVTKGTDEPYRMMTSRSEYRLCLRQDNADLRLTPIAIQVGLATSERIDKFNLKLKDIQAATQRLSVKIDKQVVSAVLGEDVGSHTVGQLIKRTSLTPKQFAEISDVFSDLSLPAVRDLFISCRYEGYLVRQEKARKEQARLENMQLAVDDYTLVKGLRTEAAEKLNKIKPLTIGQASRISGVNPADVNVLILTVKK